MHPQLMTMYADAQSAALRTAAVEHRRSRLARPRAGWSFTFRLPRRATRVAV